MMLSRSRVRPWVWVLVLIAAQAKPAVGQETPISPAGAAAYLKRGRDLAQQYCSGCHLVPDPGSLTKRSWVHYLQPEMAKWLGVERVDYEGMPDGKLLEAAGIFPAQAIISEQDWFAIWDYYRAAAPSEFPARSSRPSPVVGLKQFRVHKINHHSGVPMTTLVKIDGPRRRMFAGDVYGGSLFALNPAGEVTRRVRLDSPPVALSIQNRGIYATLIGRFFPSDALEGKVSLLTDEFTPASGQPGIDHLRRPTDTVVADLNQDRRDDIVVCSFGNRLGRFSWFEALKDGGYEEHVLLDRAGSVRADVRDFNGDGRPDILVLAAQGREGLYLFLNQGAGKFTLEPVLELPPTWGLVGFEVADFNGDGYPDLVVVNGDNGDWPLPMKPYHGIRIYLNDGNRHFREVFFYPMNGAYKVVARDFDKDGDLDLAAISFYPDFTQARPESFVYLENQGNWKFAAFTCPEQNDGRWLVMDAGDLDGDGDEDIILGSFLRGPTTVPVPSALREAWRTNGAALLLLENVGR